MKVWGRAMIELVTSGSTVGLTTDCAKGPSKSEHCSTLCLLGNFACFLLSADFFFEINYFEKIILGIPSECQTVWIQIRPDILSGLIWVQTVCQGYQQMTLVGKGLREITQD